MTKGTAFFAIVFLLPVVVEAANKPGYSLLRNDTFNLEAALQRVAAQLFPPLDMGPLYEVERASRVELHSEGVEYERYTVARGGQPRGEFIRMKLVGDVSTRVDLAVALDGSRIRRVVPLRTPILEGVPCPRLCSMFEALRGKEPAAFGSALSGLFHAMIFFRRIAAVRASTRPPLPPDMARQLFELMPKPVDTVPAFAVQGMDGAALSTATVRGKPLLLVFGRVSTSRSGPMLDLVRECMHGRRWPGRLVVSLLDAAEDVAIYRERGGVLFGTVVADPQGELKKAFSIPSVPYLVGFDAAGRLKLTTLFEGEETVRNRLDGFLREVGGR